MLLAIVGGALTLAGAFIIVALFRSLKPTMTLGQPTDKETKIKTDGDDLAKRIADQADKDSKEVTNADRKTLLQRGRDLLSRGVRK